MSRFCAVPGSNASLPSYAWRRLRHLFAALLVAFAFAPATAAASSAYECSGNSPWLGFFGDEIAAAKACSDVAIFAPNGIIESATCPNSWAGPYYGGIYQDYCTVAWHFWADDPGNPHWEERVWGVYVNSCGPNTGATFDSNGNCVLYGDRYFSKANPRSCPAPNPAKGDPIYPLTGSRRQDVDLGLMIGGQPITLTYDTSPRLPEAGGGITWLVPPPPSFGAMWQSNLHKRLVLQGNLAAGAAFSTVALSRGSGSWETASVRGYDSCSSAASTGQGGGGSYDYVPTVNLSEKLTLTGTGSAGNLIDQTSLSEESYDSSGNVTALALASGATLNFKYTSGLLTSVSDQFGRTVQFSYEQPADATQSQRINLITAADASPIHVGYDGSNNLSTLTWADGQVQQFVYENAAFPWALTGIVDESNSRYGTYGYDAQGRANSTFVGNGIDKYTVTYGTPPAWSVTETHVNGNLICREHRWVAPSETVLALPNLEVSNISATVTDGMVGLSAQDQPAGSGCSAASSAQGYDANGNVASYDDFNGSRVCYGYDTSRNLRTVTLEGLAGGTAGKACPADLGGYSPSTSDPTHPERKTTTAWHPDWVLKTREAEPKKLTTWVYNGQPDPIAGGTASCVTPSTTLPDGKPLAVLCARYEQATTDATGAQGLSATVTGATRAWTYTYNQYGQVLTATTPKQSPSDTLSHTTTYAYYADTSLSGGVGHTIGDLRTVTNPRGQVTSYTSYDAAGRLLSSTDPNNTVTTNTYWPRGWLKTQTVTPASGAAQLTSYAYYPTGLLQTVTLPDGTTLNYAYDTAHRLTDVTDAAGNTLHYTLDNSGNRTGEQVKDASGVLASTVTRVFDNLNRVQSVTGAMQ